MNQVLESRRSFIDKLFRRSKDKEPSGLTEDDVTIRDSIMATRCQFYPNGMRYYDLRIEEGSPLWRRLELVATPLKKEN